MVVKNRLKNIFMSIRSKDLDFESIKELKRIASGVVLDDDAELLEDIQLRLDNSDPNTRLPVRSPTTAAGKQKSKKKVSKAGSETSSKLSSVRRQIVLSPTKERERDAGSARNFAL